VSGPTTGLTEPCSRKKKQGDVGKGRGESKEDGVRVVRWATRENGATAVPNRNKRQELIRERRWFKKYTPMRARYQPHIFELIRHRSCRKGETL